ncbi:hypothetical protein DMP06_11175, partial [Slackia equolifaciens]
MGSILDLTLSEVLWLAGFNVLLFELPIACRKLVSRAALKEKRPLPRIDRCEGNRFERKATATMDTLQE